MKVVQPCPTLCDPMEFSRPEYWSGQLFPSPGDLPNPGIEPRSPILQEDSLPAEPPGKPKNTGVGNLSLLQQIFLTQGLLCCRWILYQLSYNSASSYSAGETETFKGVCVPAPSWKEEATRGSLPRSTTVKLHLA